MHSYIHILSDPIPPGGRRSSLLRPRHTERKPCQESGDLGARHTIVHIRQWLSTVSNPKQVYCMLNNWCIWIDLSCGLGVAHEAEDVTFERCVG